jgi:putative serine protease PepD
VNTYETPRGGPGDEPGQWPSRPAWESDTAIPRPTWTAAAYPGGEAVGGPMLPPRTVPVRPAGRGTAGSVALVLGAAVVSAALASSGTFLLWSNTRSSDQASVAGATPSPAAAPGTSAASPVVVTIGAQGIAAAVAAAASPSVVTVTLSGSRGAAGGTIVGGSGFVVATDLVLTANHILTGAAQVGVTLPDGKQIAGRIVATNTAVDLAVIRVSGLGLAPLSLGSSSGLVIGQVAIAIGSPLGTFTQSVTEGIVSGLGREVTIGGRGLRNSGGVTLTGLIQTDAAVSEGNAGGPLLDSSGRVIGIVVSNSTDAQGIGFAVPIDEASSVIDQATKAT